MAKTTEPVEKKRKLDQERRKAVGLDGTVRARLYTRRKRDRVVTGVVFGCRSVCISSHLGVPQPARPAFPTEQSIMQGTAGTPAAYMRQLIPYVNYRLTEELSASGVISKPLAEVPPLALTDSARALARSYKESWCHENARISLSHPGVYEVARNPFELETLAPQFNGEHIQGICGGRGAAARLCSALD